MVWWFLLCTLYYILTITVERVAWFKAALEGSVGALTEEEVRLLTRRYGDMANILALTDCQSFIDREDEQLDEAKSQRRPGRPRTKIEEDIILRKDVEEGEYKSGFWTPDLRDDESRFKLERWAGDWGGLHTLKFIRVVRDGEIKASSFPPRGLS